MEWKKLKIKENKIEIFNLNDELKNSLINYYPNFELINEGTTVFTYVVNQQDLATVIHHANNYLEQVDIMFWVIYPKQTSKKYKKITEVNRDIIWKQFNDKTKMRPVALFSLSQDYSAMRLRFKKFVK